MLQGINPLTAVHASRFIPKAEKLIKKRETSRAECSAFAAIFAAVGTLFGCGAVSKLFDSDFDSMLGYFIALLGFLAISGFFLHGRTRANRAIHEQQDVIAATRTELKQLDDDVLAYNIALGEAQDKLAANDGTLTRAEVETLRSTQNRLAALIEYHRMPSLHEVLEEQEMERGRQVTSA